MPESIVSHGNAGGHEGRLVYKLVEMSKVVEGDTFFLEATHSEDHLYGKPPIKCRAVGDAHELLGDNWGVNVEILDEAGK